MLAIVHPGELITPSLRLVEQLGVGGMGSVWIADHLTLHSRVAVKFMARELAMNDDVRQRFSREAAAASQVKSPHVVQMFDHGLTSDGVPFIAMELLEGEDLARRARRVGRLPLPTIAAVLTQAGKALSKAHERGIVHRDIKPENIFLCDADDGEVFVKVLDFGIAKVSDNVSNSTKTGAVMGTAYYMSPEQIVGSKNVDHRTDVWALGVVVYELLTGARPFDGETIGALALAIHAAALPTPTSVNPSLPPAIDAWFAKACARDVAQRYQTVKEMTRDLAVILGEPPRASSSGGGDGSGAPMRANTPLPAPAQTLSTTTAGQSAAHVAQSMPPTKSRAPLFIALALVAAGAVGAAVFFTRGAAPSSSPSTTVEANDPPPKRQKERKSSDETEVTPVPGVAVSSPPTTTAPTTTASATETTTAATTTKKTTPSPTPTSIKPHPTTGGTTTSGTTTLTTSTTPTGATTKPTTTPTSTGPSEPPIY